MLFLANPFGLLLNSGETFLLQHEIETGAVTVISSTLSEFLQQHEVRAAKKAFIYIWGISLPLPTKNNNIYIKSCCNPVLMKNQKTFHQEMKQLPQLL